jgi:Protein of unknown function (DUF3892)
MLTVGGARGPRSSPVAVRLSIPRIEVSVGSYRVDASAKVDVFVGGSHRHIDAICLEDRRRLSTSVAIRNIRLHRETYYTLAGGQRADVEVSTQCSLCYSEYLRTNRDSATRNNLLELPDC